jgi:pilus assembly protein TadC
VATLLFLLFWLALSVLNLWIGVSHAGYTLAEELPILALIFGLPAVTALFLRWR